MTWVRVSRKGGALEETIHRRTDRADSAGSRRGDDGAGCDPQAQHFGTDVLPLEVEVRRPERVGEL